jgi:hypothetical protein
VEDRLSSGRLCAPPRLRRKRKALIFNAGLGDAAEPDWATNIDQVIVHGSLALTEVVFFHRSSHTAPFADPIRNFPRAWFKRWRGFLTRHGGIVGPNPGAPDDWQASSLDRPAARMSLDKVRTWPIERVLIAHGDLPTRDDAAFVRSAFTWLLGHEGTT